MSWQYTATSYRWGYIRLVPWLLNWFLSGQSSNLSRNGMTQFYLHSIIIPKLIIYFLIVNHLATVFVVIWKFCSLNFIRPNCKSCWCSSSGIKSFHRDIRTCSNLMISRGYDRCDNPCPCSSGNEVVPGSWMDTRTPADGVVTPMYSS